MLKPIHAFLIFLLPVYYWKAIFFDRRMELLWEFPGAFSDLNRSGRCIDFIKKNRPDVASIGWIIDLV